MGINFFFIIFFFRDISSKSALKSISSKYKSSDFGVLNGIDVKSNHEESIENITLPIINIGNTNFTSIDQSDNGSTDADDDDVVVPKRLRRQRNNKSTTSGISNDELFLQLDSISDSVSSSGSDFAFESGLTSAKKTSAGYGRRSQLSMLSQTAGTNRDILSVNRLNEVESRHENSKNRINLEEELLQALYRFDINSESTSAKNSARYGRRAPNTDRFLDGLTQRNIQNEKIFDTDLTLDPITYISQSRRNSHAIKQKNTDLNLEESWKSLKAFNKKHKGRISESKGASLKKKILKTW